MIRGGLKMQDIYDPKLSIYLIDGQDEDGKDILMSLKDADVGAIYLSNVDSQFSLRDASYNMNGMLRKTGLFLRESTGAAGTINHVDLTS